MEAEQLDPGTIDYGMFSDEGNALVSWMVKTTLAVVVSPVEGDILAGTAARIMRMQYEGIRDTPETAEIGDTAVREAIASTFVAALRARGLDPEEAERTASKIMILSGA